MCGEFNQKFFFLFFFTKNVKMLYKIRFYFYKLNKIKESNKIMKEFAMSSLETTAAIC